MQLEPYPRTEEQWLANYEQVRTRGSSSLIPKATDQSHQGAMHESDPVIHRWQMWIEGGMEYRAQEILPDGGIGPDGDLGDGDAAPPDNAPTWDNLIGGIMITEGCTGCHGQSGAYSLQSYQAALGFGSGGAANVIPGDASSLLITYCENGHRGGMAEANSDLVRQWIVENDASEN